MDDRQLLEAAARAADRPDGSEWLLYPEGSAPAGRHWNPLTDDGDALRLAVHLGLEIYHSINNDRWTVCVGYPEGQRIRYVMEEWGDDPMAATRRAIVRAAAAAHMAREGG